MSSPPMPPHVDPPEPGDLLEVGAYQVLGRLGRGGMGTVHLGRGADGRLVAIKIVHEELARDEEFRVRFATEVENAQRVASFCTAQVLGRGEADGRPYMVTEFIDGETLYQHVSRTGPLAPGTLHGVAVGVAAGLAAIHSAGLVHRDLKPANVILSVSGPRVIDFGIARALDVASGATPTGFIVGSPGWIAPEQLLNRQIGTFADIFSWACLISYAGNGRHPYGRGDAVTMAARILHAEPDTGAVPEPLHSLLSRALSPEPTDRPTALELLLALVGGGSQSVERATEQLLSTGWQPPVPGDAAPPDAPRDPRTPPPAGPPATPPGGTTPSRTADGGAAQDGTAQGGAGQGGVAAGGSAGDAVQHYGDHPYAASAWPAAPTPGEVPGVPWAGMRLGGEEEPATIAVPPVPGDEATPPGAAAAAVREPAAPGEERAGAAMAGPHDPTDPGAGQAASGEAASAPDQTDPSRADPAQAMTGVLEVASDTDVPGAPGRGRRRAPLIIAAVVVLVIALGGGGYAYFERLDGGPATFQAVPLGRTHPTDVGRPLHLGPADTTVGQPRCGPSEFRGRQAQGRFCLIPLLMYNDGDSAIGRHVRLSPQRLQLLDSGGNQRTPVAVVDGLSPGDTDLPDGARAAGNLLFDLPRGADPVCIWLFTTEPHAAEKVKAWL